MKIHVEHILPGVACVRRTPHWFARIILRRPLPPERFAQRIGGLWYWDGGELVPTAVALEIERAWWRIGGLVRR